MKQFERPITMSQKTKPSFAKLRDSYRGIEKHIEKRIRYRDSMGAAKKWWDTKPHDERIMIYLWIIDNNHAFHNWKGSPLELAYTEMYNGEFKRS